MAAFRERLRRLFGRARGSSRKPAAASRPQQDAGPRIDAARDRLKATIPPRGDQAHAGADRPEGRAGAGAGDAGIGSP